MGGDAKKKPLLSSWLFFLSFIWTTGMPDLRIKKKNRKSIFFLSLGKKKYCLPAIQEKKKNFLFFSWNVSPFIISSFFSNCQKAPRFLLVTLNAMWKGESRGGKNQKKLFLQAKKKVAKRYFLLYQQRGPKKKGRREEKFHEKQSQRKEGVFPTWEEKKRRQKKKGKGTRRWDQKR